MKLNPQQLFGSFLDGGRPAWARLHRATPQGDLTHYQDVPDRPVTLTWDVDALVVTPAGGGFGWHDLHVSPDVFGPWVEVLDGAGAALFAVHLDKHAARLATARPVDGETVALRIPITISTV